MGFIFPLIKMAAKIGVVVFGTFFLQMISLIILSFVPLTPEIQGLALLMATLCYAVALLVLVFGRSVRGMKWPILIGFGFISLTLLAGILLLILSLVVANPTLQLLVIGDLLVALLVLLFANRQWLRSLDLVDRHLLVAAVEVHPEPAPAAQPSVTTPNRLRFQRVLANLATTKVPVGLRFQFLPGGHARLFLFTWADNEELLLQRQNRLHQFLAVHLPSVTLSPCQLPSFPLPLTTPASVVYLSGPPSDKADCFAALQKALRSRKFSPSEGLNAPAFLFQVFAAPGKLKGIDFWVARRRLEGQANKAQRLLAAATLLTKGIPPPPDLAALLSNPAALAKAHHVLRQFKRLNAHLLLCTQAALVCYHPAGLEASKATVQSLAKRVVSTLQPALPTPAVEYKFPRFGARQLRRLLRCTPVGPPTYLLLEEAAAYFGI